MIQRYFALIVIFCNGFALIYAGGQDDQKEYPIVKTTNGYVKGLKNVTIFQNKPYYSFRGIPYAAPPIKHLRFKPPISAKPWKGVRDAFSLGNECLQVTEIINVFNDILQLPYISGDEDCLSVNIYTPDVSGNFPVMVHILGGVFSEAPIYLYGPDFIINEDVILVTFNYRLGPFGFMSLGTEEYSGNLAIKDSLFALKWINENIEQFGGDKNRITICGFAASATFTNLFTISEASKYLFQRAIMMSGSILNIWGVNERKDHLAVMFGFAQKNDPSVKTFDDLIEFLQNVNATYLLESFIQKIDYLAGLPRKKIANYIWSPILNVPFDDHSKLIESSDKLLKHKVATNSIDTLFGYVNRETIFYLSREVQNPSLLKSFNNKYQVQLPLNHNDDIRYETKAYQRIAKYIHDSYFGPGVIVDENTLPEYVDLTSDMWVKYAVDLAARIQAKSSSGRTYLYEFAVDTDLNVVKKLLNVSLPGASVGDDLSYLFKFPIPNLYDNIEENSVAGRAIQTEAKVFTNFVKYGDPSLDEKIKPIINDQVNYFRITNDGIVLGRKTHSDSMTVWDNIYTKYYKSLLRSNILNG